MLCADYHTAQNTRIKFKWVEGVEATDWSDVASREKLDSVHTELRRLEQLAHVMHYELQHIRRKEEQMRDVNGKWFFVRAGTVASVKDSKRNEAKEMMVHMQRKQTGLWHSSASVLFLYA